MNYTLLQELQQLLQTLPAEQQHTTPAPASQPAAAAHSAL
jgi:hypothetical protein